MYLPEELVREILKKLRSTKSAVRLSSVCKSWRDLTFKDPDFGAKFFNKKDDPILLLHRHKHSDGDQIEYQIRTRYSHASLGFPKYDIPKLKEIGSCNGILCLKETIPMDTKVNDMFQVNTQVNLYNPITRKFRKIPHPCVGVLGYGFGYDSTTCDYKVIRISQNMAEIYKLSTNCWSKLEVKHRSFYDRRWFCDSFVYAKGCCYWRSNLGINVSFDFRTETFGFMDGPWYAASYYLGLLDNSSLAVCKPELWDNKRKTYTAEIRVRSKDGDKVPWDVCFSISGGSSGEWDAKSGACWVEGTTLFQLKPDGKVTTYERRGTRGSKSRLFRFDSPLNSMTFKPSLVSLASNCFVPAPRY